MTLAAGTRLGPHEILGPLGAGGMGEVYKARDTRLERTVAIKVLPQHLSASPEVRQRFEREAKTISQLSHPHICALYDVGNQDGVEYLVMEFLEGETLADRLAKGLLPLEQTRRYGVEIADALDKAHRQRIVHRDLKPGNVMLTKSGVKLLDFGLAKAISPTTSLSGMTALPTLAGSAPLTQEGTILGTFQYMAPEQLEGKEADARTDIFSFGAVLYEMATGKKAFSASSQASLITAIMASDPPPISETQKMSPPALDRVVRRCLAKDPEKRWQSARDVGLELQEVERESPETALRGRARRSVADLAGWGFAALLLLALLGLTLGPWGRRKAAPEGRLRFTIPPPSGAALQGMLALSPDGRALAFVATTSEGRDLLFLRRLDSLDARPLAGTEGAAYPFWSPDGKSLAFFAQGKLKRIDPAGGSPQTLCDVVSPRGGSWGSGGILVFSANTGGQIQSVGEAGGEPRLLGQMVSRSGEVYRWPTFLPDGRHFLYFGLTGAGESTGVFLASLDSKETTRLVSADSGAMYSPPGYLLYRSGDRIVAQAFDAKRLRLAGDAVPLVEDVWWDGISTLATAFTVSSDGVLAYQTGGLAKTKLVLYDRVGKEIGSPGPPGAYIEPALSPDGRWLVVGRAEPGTSGSNLWMIDLERGSIVRVSYGQCLAASTSVWSSDGRRFAYSCFPSGEVYVRDAHGVEKERLLFKSPSFSPLDDWSRDGRYLFQEIVDWKTFHFDVGMRDLQSGADRPLLTDPFDEMGARLSPDGRWLAYESSESGTHEVFVRNFPELGDRRQISVGGGSQPRWRADGKELFYVSPDRKVMAVDIRSGSTLESSSPRALFQTQIVPAVEARNHFDAAPDGQRFVVNSRRPEDASLPINVVVNWISDLAKR
jgi:Tol biopolymer transport system component